MRATPFLLATLSFAAAGCAGSAGNDQALGNSAAPAAPANAAAPAPLANAAPSGDRLLRSETVTGIFAGWEMGDYLWAKIAVPGRHEISAQPGPTPIDLFLDAHRGRPVTVEIATVTTNIPEAGGETEIQRITAARSGATTAEAWWQGLSAADRAAAQRRFEQGPLSGS
jgi:hypothetical protein